MKKLFRTAAAVLTGTLLLSGCTQLDLSQDVEAFPEFNSWTSYGTGTATYADLAAAANTISNATDAQVRILTSDTAIGRLTPLRKKQATMGRLGDEHMFAYYGDEEFANPEWGPQDLRLVWAPTAPHSLMVTAASGIETPEDLRGKKVPKISANPSVNNKYDALLAYGGLTWDDVTPVTVSYSEQPEALKSGKIDIAFQQVYGASLYELANTIDTKWIGFDPAETEKVAALQAVAPAVEIEPFTRAAGQDEGQEDYGMIYSVPLTSYADLSETQAYETAKALQEHYPDYRDATVTTENWDLEHVVTMPVRVPFHEGTIRYFEEMGVWTPEAEARNEALIEYGEELRATWPEFLAQADTSGDLKAQWTAWKDTHLDPIP
ncbi:TAXI family TRAP transporter solute-binding subunit [Brevibacterium samyangense]|uniref:TAXI family TRAP transporter solute-binding subunit n=1 Tax=Brevibacterium samyangense TaxID=366888 RepID=A0ABP5EQS4_9MICO